ncbi:MAG TPA: amidohydrolase family protein [Candidatus Binatia bacterium]|jgi:hypothetical protein
MKIIDADGHINDRACMEELAKYLPSGNRFAPVFPELDHLHTYFLRKDKTVLRTGNPGPEEWLEVLDKTGIDATVLYPTAGLAVGRIASSDWAVAACRAYNHWLYDRFLSFNDRIKGVALIPIQNVESAVKELRRAVTELGMLGAMLPSNGEGMNGHLGARQYWPIYEEAEKLGCALAIHGGCHHHLGMDSFENFFAVRALGHPFSIMVQAAAMLFHGVFERFPKLRIAFLEGGATWVPFFMDRIDRSYEGISSPSHVQVDVDGELLLGPKAGESASEYFRRQIREGRIFVGFDCDDVGLGFAIQRAGREAFLFASDFPHEAINAERCREEIDELLERSDLDGDDKKAVLATNAQRLYRL